LPSLNQGNLTYSIDGVTVTKTVQRQTWSNENYSRAYAGGYSILLTGCNPPSLNGNVEATGLLFVNQADTNITITSLSDGSGSSVDACTFQGTYSQTGKLGAVAGSYSCNDGTQGTFQLSEMTATISGFTSRATGQNQYCRWTGYVGGITRAQ
jgi:hypothetical protein